MHANIKRFTPFGNNFCKRVAIMIEVGTLSRNDEIKKVIIDIIHSKATVFFAFFQLRYEPKAMIRIHYFNNGHRNHEKKQYLSNICQMAVKLIYNNRVLVQSIY